MVFKPPKIGDRLTNQELVEIFQCGIMGGMRKSNVTNTLVIISDHTKGLYDDKWIGDELHYTGMGRIGDQSLTFAQNKTLLQSAESEVSVHLLEVIIPTEYIYHGEVGMVNKPYQEPQYGDDGVLRKVWMFPLKRKTGEVAVEADELDRLFQKRLRRVGKLLTADLKKRAESKKVKETSRRKTSANRYDRDPLIVEYALRRARGICQLCEKPAPFQTKAGEPYLQVHHIRYLSNQGSDTIDNVVGLCPNCHAKVHALEKKQDVDKMLRLASEKL